MALPLDIRDLMSSGAKLNAEREKPLRIAVFVDAEAPDAAVQVLKEALRAQTANGRIHVEPAVPGDVLQVDSSADAVIALAGPGTTLAESVRRARDAFIPTAVVALGEPKDSVSRRLDHPLVDVVVSDDPAQLADGLGLWLAERLPGKRIALAANFGFVRRAVAEEAVKSTSFQNAVIGGVAFIPGADLPLMTANQAKMVLQIAAAYGQPLGAERVKELAAVLGGAFALRTVARQFVGLIPGFGWALKAGIGYSGTLAMGYAAIEYFENGGDVRGLGAKLVEARDKAIEAARRRGRKREVIPAQAWEAGAEPGAQVPGATVGLADPAVDPILPPAETPVAAPGTGDR